MSLEQQIVEWGASRPPWQRAVLKRLASGDVLSDEDYDNLADALVTSKEVADATFGLEDLPQVEGCDPPVTLVSIEDLEHVNALASDRPLTFETAGLTVIYGDNGTGKSGYARLLKRIVRARHREEILSDVFRDTQITKPKAAVTMRSGGNDTSFTWPDAPAPELQRILFYDEACGDAYVATESDFPFRPSALFVMDGLIQACVAIRIRIDAKLEEIARSQRPLPRVDEEVRETDAGRYVGSISAASSPEILDSLIEMRNASSETIEDLTNEEVRLRTTDTAKERQKLARQASKLESLRNHLEGLDRALGDEAIGLLQEERARLKALEEVADLVGKSLHSEPLSGVGTSAWKELWEAARRFSDAHAYPDKTFPVVGGDARCVLCQQPLDLETAGERLSRFERFVQDDTQTRLRDARVPWEERAERLSNLSTSPEAVEANVKDLESEYVDLVRGMRALLAQYEVARASIVDALPGNGDLPRFGVTSAGISPMIGAAVVASRMAAEGLANSELIKGRLAAIGIKRKELQLLEEMRNQREVIIDEIARCKRREALEVVKNAAATGPITKKILELSEDSITEVVRDTFTRETERLRLERVTITKTRGDRGTLLHQPKLVGARQNVTLPHVFSEGERTALGLAAFFTEAQLDASKSALVLDDPVSSLDHIRRELVAVRLAALADARQVVVFTHDVSFVADLKREARAIGVLVTERAVVRGRGGDKRPGTCSIGHPWKAKDVAERFGELRTELARVKRDHNGWDDATYEKEVATWAGNLSETWERIFSQELVGTILAAGGLEVRPSMVKILARFSETDEREFQASYARVSQWAKRHDKSSIVNYVAPEVIALEEEFGRVEQWFKRVKAYKN